MTTTSKSVERIGGRRNAGWRGGLSLMAVLLAAGAPGCGPEGTLEELTLERQSQDLDSMNGLSANGLSANGLSANGLSVNGLSANGLSVGAFSAWFTQDPALADNVMRYVVRCAVPAGETRSYTDPQTGQRYTWTGGLGLAVEWAKGAAPTRAEQEVVTACLLAHVNRHEQSITISVLGKDAKGKNIPFTNAELATYSVREACFFGNLFTQQGLFFGVDRAATEGAQYQTRACVGMAGSCEPLTYVGACSQSCTLDPKGPFYKSCTRNGVSYVALSTRMREADFTQLFPDASATGLSSDTAQEGTDSGSRKHKHKKK